MEIVMERANGFYFCPTCFETAVKKKKCHRHWMVHCKTGNWGSELRKPLRDAYGQMVSRAPRWYLEGLGRIPAWTAREIDHPQGS